MIPDYEDLEAMLFQGFLTLPLSLYGVPVVLKTMNSREYELVDAYVAGGTSGDSKGALTSAYILAYSTYLFNRVNVLGRREAYMGMLLPMFMDLPPRASHRIMLRLMDLNDRALKTIKQVEPYSYGALSRQSWSAYRGHLLNAHAITGVRGTESLGVNYHQKLWMYLNEQEDIQQGYDRDRELAKFQISAHAPKGVKQLEQQDRDRRRKEERRRADVYAGAGRGQIAPGEQEIRISNDSVDALLSQMRQQQSGQKDYHDMVIARHEGEQRRRYEERRAALALQRDAAREARREALESNVRPENSFIIYDEGDIARQVEAARQRRQEDLRAGKYHAAMAMEEDDARMARWSAGKDNEETPGPFSPTTILGEYYREGNPGEDPEF